MTLELGGKRPQIVFADADLDAALPVIVNAASRTPARPAPRARACWSRTAPTTSPRTAGRALPGAGRRPGRERPRLRAADHAAAGARRGYLRAGAADGLRCGQGPIAPNPPAGGFYVAPTLLGDVPADHALAQEEMFGPVLVAMRSTTRTMRSGSPTARLTAWSPACGRATAGARCAWRARSARARSSSTTTVQAAASSCRSAA